MFFSYQFAAQISCTCKCICHRYIYIDPMVISCSGDLGQLHQVLKEMTIVKRQLAEKHQQQKAAWGGASEMAVVIVMCRLHVWHIFTNMWLECMVDVGKYAMTMEHMGYMIYI